MEDVTPMWRAKDGSYHSSAEQAHECNRRNAMSVALAGRWRKKGCTGNWTHWIIDDWDAIKAIVEPAQSEPETFELQPVNLDTLTSFVQRVATKGETFFSSYINARKFTQALFDARHDLVLMLNAHDLWCLREATASPDGPIPTDAYYSRITATFWRVGDMGIARPAGVAFNSRWLERRYEFPQSSEELTARAAKIDPNNPPTPAVAQSTPEVMASTPEVEDPASDAAEIDAECGMTPAQLGTGDE